MNSIAFAVLTASLTIGLPVQPHVDAGGGLKASTTEVVTRLAAAPRSSAAVRSRSAGPTPRAGTGAQIAGGILGGVIGFFTGAYTGAAIENHASPCRCDDPGLRGAVIGGPVGAVAGAIIGVLLVR